MAKPVSRRTPAHWPTIIGRVEAQPNVGRETYGAVPLPMKFIIRTMMKITMKM